MTKKMVLQPFVDIATYIEGFEIVSSSLGGNGSIYVLLIDRIPERERGMFVQTSLRQFRTYKVLIIKSCLKSQLNTDFNMLSSVIPCAKSNHVPSLEQNSVKSVLNKTFRTRPSISEIQEVILVGEKFNYHYVQPLGQHQLLLVGARAKKYRNQDYDHNAKVCDFDGNIIREFLLGDGIQDVQVTAEGTIWTSYFDEGVFGNFGWDDPVGASGLVAWDEHGKKIFENNAAEIADCYALNVVSEDEVWFYYYYDFKLGNIQGGTEQPYTTFIDPRISGSSGFCTNGYYFLFDAGYSKHGTYILKKQDKPGRLVGEQKIQFVDEQGERLQGGSALRQNQLLLTQDSKLYLVAIEQLVE